MTIIEPKHEDTMTDATADEAEAPKKSGKKGLITALILAIVGAGAGFYATRTGLLPVGGYSTPKEAQEPNMGKAAKAVPDVEFIELPPVVVSVNVGDSRHLKFRAQLEVNAGYASDVVKMQPRIIDVINTYLRAVELRDLDDPMALVRIRGHLLRRIAIVAGDGRVRDVLIMEFVLN